MSVRFLYGFRINHGGSHIVMTGQFLNCTDVVTLFEQGSSEGMAQSVTGCPFCEFGLRYGALESFLQDGLVNVMPTLFAGLGGSSISSPGERNLFEEYVFAFPA